VGCYENLIREVRELREENIKLQAQNEILRETLLELKEMFKNESKI